MAWPNNYNSFWEAMYNPEPHAPRGAGVDHAAPPPPRELPDFMNPDYWNRWSQAWAQGPPGGGSWPYGPHAHHNARHRGGRGGHRHRAREDAPNEGSGLGSGSDNENENDDNLPEYISDDEVAYATAAAEADGKKQHGASDTKDKEKDKSPDTMMQDKDAEDPPEEIPDQDDDHWERRGGRHGRGGSRGFGRRGRGHGGHGGHGGSGGFGPQRRHSGGRHGEHRGPPPFPFGPFGPFGSGPHRGGQGPRAHGGPHHGPPPFPVFDFAGGVDGDHPHPPPPPHAHGRRHGRHGHPRGPHPPPPPPPGGDEPLSQGPFDFRGMMAALANHPYAHHLRHYLERLQEHQDNNNNNQTARGGRAATPDSSSDDDGIEGTITPPLDLFDLPDRWVLHIAMPGAKKEDTGVHWDADRALLTISGVVYRPGDEDFLKALVSGERRVGLLSREVRLPPAVALGETGAASKEEVDADGIAAKMEDGILIVTVPKVEKTWTEVKRVGIE